MKIKKKKPTQLSTLNHSHAVVAPQRDSSTHHTPLHHSKVHPPHAAGWRTFAFIRTADQTLSAKSSSGLWLFSALPPVKKHTRRYEIPPQPSAHASALGFSFFLLVHEVGDEVDGGRERRLAVEEAREGVEEKARRPDEVAEKYAVAREHPALDTVEPD